MNKKNLKKNKGWSTNYEGATKQSYEYIKKLISHLHKFSCKKIKKLY